MSTRRAIRILNPRAGGQTHTSAKRAIEYIGRGIARWKSDTSIEFIESDHRCVSATRAANAGVAARRRFFSGRGFASLDAIANIPVIKPVLLITGKRPAEPPRELPDDYEISRRYLGCTEF